MMNTYKFRHCYCDCIYKFKAKLVNCHACRRYNYVVYITIPQTIDVYCHWMKL